jgi:hypothetical protein
MIYFRSAKKENILQIGRDPQQRYAGHQKVSCPHVHVVLTPFPSSKRK